LFLLLLLPLAARAQSPPVINQQPASLTNNAGTTAVFSVAAVGDGLLSYQWTRNGSYLFGANSSTLALSNVFFTDTGSYNVIVTSGSEHVNSDVATLMVIDPVINTQPLPQAKNARESVTLSVEAAGFPPLTYQWRKEGVPKDGATEAALTLTNLGAGDGGSYDVVIMNGAGRTTNSAAAMLSVNLALPDDFNPAVGYVFSVVPQADGKILVGGAFGRLNADGTLDTSFNPGADGSVTSLALQADGRVVAGGYFTTLGGQIRSHLGRVNSHGTLDPEFNPGVASSTYLDVYSLAVQADGKILVGGIFTGLGGQNRPGLGRLNADGTLDTSFNPGAGGGVTALALQADGKILVGGAFFTLDGQSRTNLGRLNNTESATQSLTFDGATLTWMRGGTSPEVWRTSFDYSLDGASWTNLGAGLRIPGGWQLTGLALPGNATLRARGWTVVNNSGWFLETAVGPPALETQPISGTNAFGTSAAFSVWAVGSGPLSFQWRKDGRNLADGGSVSGALTAGLTVGNGAGSEAGGYSVVISNAAGSVTSAVAALTVIDPLINLPPASQDKNSGDTVTFSVGALGTQPLSFQWRKDGVAKAGATQSALTLTNLQGPDPGSYDVVVSNVWGSATSAVALLSVNLALPDGFNPGVSGGVYAVAVQPDGMMLVGGNFYSLGGQIRDNIGRLNADGTLNSNFNPWADSAVHSLAVQADGKILVGGDFTILGDPMGEQTRSFVGRLNGDGTVDASFDPAANASVDSLVLQADGKILIGGGFTILAGQSRDYIGRLNTDGTLDTNFNPGADNYVSSVAVAADGKILVGGRFSTLGGQSRNGIGRLNADGTLDTSFNLRLGGAGRGSGVFSLAVEADERILMGGRFTTLGGPSRTNSCRLNGDGTLDPTFDPGANGIVYSLAVQADGKILVGGQFTTLGGQSRDYIGRLNADGTLDPSFNPGASGNVLSVTVQADGRILAGGQFTTLGGQSRTNLARLNNTDPATQSLTFDGASLSWMRGGTSPEVWRTTFESSPDGGASWSDLGPGLRIPGGWQLAGLALPTTTAVRARGYATGGQYNGSSWFVETVLRPALTISALLYPAQGPFGFSAGGPLGQVVVIETSPDLRTWTPLQTNALSAGQLPFTDPQPALLPSRFYRLRSGP